MKILVWNVKFLQKNFHLGKKKFSFDPATEVLIICFTVLIICFTFQRERANSRPNQGRNWSKGSLPQGTTETIRAKSTKMKIGNNSSKPEACVQNIFTTADNVYIV